MGKNWGFWEAIRMRKKADDSSGEQTPFSKVLMVCMIAFCAEIVIYSEIAMVLLQDLSSLYALIGIVAALAGSIWAYCEKSKAENTKGGITYDAAMRNMADAENEDEDTEDAGEEEDGAG